MDIDTMQKQFSFFFSFFVLSLYRATLHMTMDKNWVKWILLGIEEIQKIVYNLLCYFSYSISFCHHNYAACECYEYYYYVLVYLFLILSNLISATNFQFSFSVDAWDENDTNRWINKKVFNWNKLALCCGNFT